jgi:hypothetical protein
LAWACTLLNQALLLAHLRLQVLKALTRDGWQGVRLVEELDGSHPYISSSTARIIGSTYSDEGLVDSYEPAFC